MQMILSSMGTQSQEALILGLRANAKKTKAIIYKYNILERVLVENIIPRNVIINRGAAEVDNHISSVDFFQLAPSQECYIYFIIPNIIPLFSNHGERSFKDNAMCKKVRMIEIIFFTKGLCL